MYGTAPKTHLSAIPSFFIGSCSVFKQCLPLETVFFLHCFFYITFFWEKRGFNLHTCKCVLCLLIQFVIMQYLAEPTATTLEGCGYALITTKTSRKQKDTIFFQRMFGLKPMSVYFCWFTWVVFVFLKLDI